MTFKNVLEEQHQAHLFGREQVAFLSWTIKLKEIHEVVLVSEKCVHLVQLKLLQNAFFVHLVALRVHKSGTAIYTCFSAASCQHWKLLRRKFNLTECTWRDTFSISRCELTTPSSGADLMNNAKSI